MPCVNFPSAKITTVVRLHVAALKAGINLT